jgi:RNase P subunit RPR2
MRHGKARAIAAVVLDHLGVIPQSPFRTRCLDCEIILLPGFNWTKGVQRKRFHICADCNTSRKRGWRGRAS